MNLETDNKIQKKGITLVIPNPCGNIKETKMKNSGVEWIGEIPEDWEISKTKYLTKLYTGNSIKDEEKNLYEDKADAVPYISSKDINATFSTTNYENGMYVKHSDNSFVRAPAGSTLMCIEGGSAGKKKTFLNQEVCFVNKLCCFSPIKIDSKFLFYCLNSPNYEEEFRFNISGMIGGVSVGKLNQFILPLPPKETQQRIASYLDKKCSKIEETIQKQQQVIEKLKAYKQSLITEAVTGKVKIANGKICGEYESYKDSKLKWLGDFKIPEKWSNIQVKSFVSIPVVDGPHESPELFDNGIPYISATAIENSKIDFSLKRGFISEKYCDECDKRYKPMKDDILMIKLGATTGQVAIVETDERFNIWVPLAAIRCNKNIALPKFVFYSFQSDYCLKQMEMSWTFGTQQTLGVSSIERLKIFLPNIETQKEIADYLDKKCTAIDTAIEQKQKLIEKLTEYKKSLIYECVTGKKEI